MNIMLSVRLTVDGPDQIRIFGPDLFWPDDGDVLRGFTKVLFRVDDTNWLRFDVDVAAESNPSGYAFGFTLAASQDVPGNLFARVIQNDPLNYSRFQFYWPSPLTPNGSGLWFNLLLKVNANDLLIVSGSAGSTISQSCLSYKADSSSSGWKTIPFNAFGLNSNSDDGITAQEWKTRWEKLSSLQPYPRPVGSPFLSLGCPLLQATSDRWLVDATIQPSDSAKSAFCAGFIRNVAEDATGEYHLVSQVRLNFPAGGVQLNEAALQVVTGTGEISPLISELTVNCVRVFNLDEPPGSAWLIDWVDVQGQSDSTVFSLSMLYRWLARHYPLGLAAVRSKCRLTYVPTGLSASKNVTLRFIITNKQFALQQIRVALDSADSVTNNSLTLSFGGATDETGIPQALIFEAPDMSLSLGDAIRHFKRTDPLLSVNLTKGVSLSGNSPIYQIISGVAVEATGLVTGQLGLNLEAGADLYGQSPIGVAISLHVDSVTLTPRSQDPEVGYETLSSWLNRERPIVIPISNSLSNLSLDVVEIANDEESRLLRVAATAQNAASSLIDIVVIDPSPFTVARIQATTQVLGGQLVAEYIDDSEQPPGWTFQYDSGSMALVLPPQVIGEEMVKGRIWLNQGIKSYLEVPEPGRLFDFRLGLPTSLSLDLTDIDTARTDAPWALRRLMGQRTGIVGVQLNQAVFELLYGLTTTINSENLRVAELDAFIGRIPFGDDLLCALRQALYSPKFSQVHLVVPLYSPIPNAAKLKEAYSHQISQWILDLFYRPSWWPIFSNAANRDVLTIGDNVTFAFRPTRQTADPFSANKFAIDHALPSQAGSGSSVPAPSAIPPIPDNDRKRLPLRGGVDWPFQSVNIYEEVLGSQSTSNSSVTGITFGSLGGSGSQNAVFANGKTIIISDTTQGRLNSLTVIRLGRIAMLWNHARHVIRYERTSRRAPRYAFGTDSLNPGVDDLDSQSGFFEGFGVLRKVREYIEIKEPRRTYPDTPSASPICGPLMQSTFETVIIPVKASWGRDVAEGWIMPLRGPFSSSDEEQYYPFPKSFLELARAVEKGGGTVPHPVADPSQLVFFTSTRAQDGGNTDVWPAWPDIDFPLIQCPGPPDLPFSSSFAGCSKQPDAATTEFGQKSFTIDLGPTGEAVNLMQGRSVPSMDAQVKNVTLARGTLPAGVVQGPVAEKIAPAFSDGAAQMYDGLAELTSHLADLSRNSATATLDDLGSLRSDIQGILGRLNDAAQKVQKAIDSVTSGGASLDQFDWQTEQHNWDDNLKNRLSGVTSNLVDLLGWTPPADLTAPLADATLTQLRHGWDALQQQGLQALQQIGFLPDQALSKIRAARTELAARLQSEASASLNQLVADLTTAQQRYAETSANQAGIIEELTEAYQAEVNRFYTLSQDAENWVENRLGPWFSRFSSIKSAIGALDNSHAFGLLIVPVQKWLQDMANYLFAPIQPPPSPPPPPPTIAQLQFDRLIKYLTDKLGKLAIDDALKQVDDIINNQLAKAPDMLDWGAGIKTLSGQFTNVCNQLCKVLSGTPNGTAVNDAIDAISQQLGTWTESGSAVFLEDKVKNLLASVSWQPIPGAFDQASEFFNNATKAITDVQNAINQSAATISVIANQVTTTAQLWARQLQAAGAQIEQAVRKDVSSIVDELPNIVPNTDLNLARVLASGPVTDTIACTRDAIGYYYDSAQDLLNVTRASAILNDLGPAVLNSLSANMPFDRIRDRLLPQIGNIDVNSLFPDFGGLKLSDLLPDLKVPIDGTEEYGWLIVKHGFDQSRLTAWADVSIDKVFDDTVLFSLPPFELQILQPRFTASSRMEVSTDGKQVQTTKAALSGNWALNLSGEMLVTMNLATLNYDSSGGFNFDFQSKNIEMAGALQFITEALADLLPEGDDGLTLTPIAPGGISVELSLPLPDIGTGAFTLTGITLYTHFDLIIATGFELRTGFWLSKPDRPFGLAILFLGGGGWIGAEVSYRPTDTFTTQVSIGISAGAFIAIDLGVVSGSAGVLFTAGLDFFHSSGAGGGGSTDISLGLLIWGELSVLGIASASLRITFRITYDNTGGMRADGEVRLSIKICWCFTLEVDSSATMQFSQPGGGNQAYSDSMSLPDLSKMAPTATLLASRSSRPGALRQPSPLPPPGNYGNLPVPAYLDTAVDLQFMNLDLN
jgi:methyl-accepting chemotaxis protein